MVFVADVDLEDGDRIRLETVLETLAQVVRRGGLWHDIPGVTQSVGILRTARRQYQSFARGFKAPCALYSNANRLEFARGVNNLQVDRAGSTVAGNARIDL